MTGTDTVTVPESPGSVSGPESTPGDDSAGTEGSGSTDTDAVPGNNTGEDANISNTGNGGDTGSDEGNETETDNGQAGNTGGASPVTDPVTDGDTNTDPAGTPEENQPSETPGAGNDGNESQEPGTDGGNEGNEGGDEKPQPNPDDEQQKYTAVIGGNEISFDDFADVWNQNINDKGKITVQLEDNITVSPSADDTDSLCKLTGGEVTLDLNGHELAYKCPAGRSTSGSPDLIEVSGGTLTIEDSSGGNGTISYTGNGNYSGACVLASGGTVTVKGGTFRSNVSAPVSIESEAVLNIEDGTFHNTSSSGSAITINNGKLSMTGGKVTGGSLSLYKKDNGLDVSLGAGSEFSEIKFIGTERGSVSEVLALDCGFRSSPSGNWITDEDALSGSSIRNVRVDKKPIRSVILRADPDQNEVQFSYNGGTEFTLTADVEPADGGSDLREYEWYQTYNDGVKAQIENVGNTYKFSTAGHDAGIYGYHVCVKSGDYEEWASFTLEIKPLPDGVITNNNYQTEYTYGDFVAPPQNGMGSFHVEPAIPEGANVRWTYRWYKDSVADDHVVNGPTNVGSYILKVEATDTNYSAVGDIPVTITPRTVTPVIDGTTSKVYDGTTEAKGVEVKLDNVVSGDAGGVGVRVASIAYNDANARLANRIVASGIELTGNKAGNYVLSSTQASVEAGISKAELLIQMSVSPNTQKVNRPVTVTVTVLNSDNSPIDNNGLKAEDVILSVSGRNDTEEEHTLALKASGSQYGVYTTEYTTGIKGDKTFTARIAGNANYEVKNVASDNTLTILEKTGAVMTLTASETEDIVYGDEVTYTAVVSKENEDDADALNGNVQFYEEEISDDRKIGSAQSVIMSGDKASITLDESVLEAGDHKILAVFSGSRSFEDVNAEVSTSVAKKQLKWDTSGLSASKAAGTAGEVTVYGELKLDGLLDEDDVTLERPAVLKTNGLKSTEAGSYKVTVVSEDKEWKFDPEEPKNYELPEGDPEITAKVNAVKELPNPPADTEDGKKFKLIMEEGISSVPEGLLNTSFNTPAKIEQELKRVLTEAGVYKPENTAIYDVVLQVSTDEGTTWQVADYTNFPEGGLLVTLPYPGGTGRYTNNFAVAHMFSTSYFGKTSGQVEIPAVRKTDNGMEFTVTGLSPIGLAWNGPTGIVNNAAGGTGSRRAQGALTWDNNPILLYTCLAGVAVLAIVVVVTVRIVHGKKKKKSSRR